MNCAVHHLILAAVVALPAAPCDVEHPGGDEQRRVRVVVTAEDFEGRPLSGLLVALDLVDDAPPVVDTVTDADGRAVLETTVPRGLSVIHVRHAFARPSTLLHEQQLRAARRLKDLRHDHHLPARRPLALEPDSETYGVAVTAWEAVDVRLRIVDEHGVQQSGVVFGPPGSGLGGIDLKAGIEWPLRSLRRGAAALIFVVSHVSTPAAIVRPILLDGTQTRADLDLGDVRIDELKGAMPIDVRLVHVRSPTMAGALFIAVDGTLIVSYRASAEEMVRGVEPTIHSVFQIGTLESPARLPPGRYYVAPGWFTNLDEQGALINAALEHRDLRDAGITMFEVSAEGPNELELNEANARRAIRQLITEGRIDVEGKTALR